MPWRNAINRWGSAAQLLHWLVALLVLGLIALGWIMVNYPISPTQFRLYALHKSVGICVLALIMLRLFWRLTDPPPSVVPGLGARERQLVLAVHGLLYALLAALTATGYLINSAANFPLSVFGLFTLPNVTGEDAILKQLAQALHLWLFWLLAALLVLHIVGALRHHYILHDDTLRRMLPRLRHPGDQA